MGVLELVGQCQARIRASREELFDKMVVVVEHGECLSNAAHASVMARIMVPGMSGKWFWLRLQNQSSDRTRRWDGIKGRDQKTVPAMMCTSVPS